MVVRGLGPTLTQFGVAGALADPALTLVDSNGNIVQSNDNWKDTQQAAIQATGLAPPNDLEAAILATLAAGHYTVILSGNGGGTGIGLLEVYKLQRLVGVKREIGREANHDVPPLVKFSR